MNYRCFNCHEQMVREIGDLCGNCFYQGRIAFMLDQDPDDQDWEFTHCEECGSSLDGGGECRNTNCGASPYVGEDWI